MDIDTDYRDKDCIDADCFTKECSNANFKHANCIDTNTNLYCSNSYNMNLDRVTDSHVELNILDDMQECFNNSYHKISFDYDEDTAKI
jgi:hypothetical protein